MKKVSVISMVTVSLLLGVTGLQAEEPKSIQTEPRMKQKERSKVPQKAQEEVSLPPVPVPIPKPLPPQNDPNREIKMIMLNQMLNKKGNVVHQLTNEINKSKSHNTKQKIINNLK